LAADIRAPEALAARVNAHVSHLVFKDSSKAALSSPALSSAIDAKRVLDLSEDRLATLLRADPDLRTCADIAAPLDDVLSFWRALSSDVCVRLSHAVDIATGAAALGVATDNGKINWRMAHYANPSARACGAHRDFGSFSVIVPDADGLEVFEPVSGAWLAVPHVVGTAVLVFGYCTHVRSNGRIPAALHRVVSGNVPRTSFVLFAAPADNDAELSPMLRDGEAPAFAPLTVGRLRDTMAPAWRSREGTISSAEAARLERHELGEPIADAIAQDVVLRKLCKV
jgi:isopenicillin N synthase-like dioxygenase